MADAYRSLDAARIVETARALRGRIEERFRESGLARVAAELEAVSREAAATSAWLEAPNRWVRAGVAACILLLLLALGVGVASVHHVGPFFSSLAELMQGLDAAVNDAIFLGLALFFLLTWEGRLKRRRALGALHVLRSMAHIIDMHQLTKDPERVARAGPDTPSSPKRALTPFELTRYLDYCSEMLSVISKIAALYVQRLDDPQVLAAVNEIETLTAGLSRKIWQKIMILDRIGS